MPFSGRLIRSWAPQGTPPTPRHQPGRAVFKGASGPVVPEIAVQAVAAVDSTHVQITFTTGATRNLALVDPGNYVITPALEVDAVVPDGNPNPLVVTLTTKEMKQGQAYALEIQRVQAPGHPVLSGVFVGIGIAPNITAAAATGASTVLVSFDEAMAPGPLATAGNYTIPTLAVLLAVPASDGKSVTLIVSGMQVSTTYNVTVNPVVTDLAGNALNVNVASFTTPASFLPPTPPTPQPSGGAAGDCGVIPFTQDDLLDLFSRVLPESYLAPLRDIGPGYELLQAYAQLWARVSLAVEHLACASYVLSASTSAKATGQVQFSRPAVGPAVTIQTGTLLKASGSGRLFRTTAPAVLGLGDIGPVSTTVIAVHDGYAGNVLGQTVMPNGEIEPGEIDTIVLPIQDPALADATVVVTQAAPLAGGLPPALEQLGADRGVDQQPGEPVGHYRARVRALPDTISPAAFRRAFNDVTASLQTTYNLIETPQINYQTCWDAPIDAIPASPLYDPTLFVYDDPRAPTPFRDRWLSVDDQAGVIITTPLLAAIADNGMGYDDPATSQSDLQTTLGARATCAYDIPDVAPGIVTPPGAYDGFDSSLLAVYLGMLTLAQTLKAGGVLAVLEVEGG